MHRGRFRWLSRRRGCPEGSENYWRDLLRIIPCRWNLLSLRSFLVDFSSFFLFLFWVGQLTRVAGRLHFLDLCSFSWLVRLWCMILFFYIFFTSSVVFIYPSLNVRAAGVFPCRQQDDSRVCSFVREFISIQGDKASRWWYYSTVVTYPSTHHIAIPERVKWCNVLHAVKAHPKLMWDMEGGGCDAQPMYFFSPMSLGPSSPYHNVIMIWGGFLVKEDTSERLDEK